MNQKWGIIVAAVLSVIWLIKEHFEGKAQGKLTDTFKEQFDKVINRHKKEAIANAKEKRDDTVDSDLDDWLDDELGDGFGGPS